MVCTETGNYADMKGVVEKLCHQTGACSYDQKQQLDALFGNLGAVEKEQNESGDSK